MPVVAKTLRIRILRGPGIPLLAGVLLLSSFLTGPASATVHEVAVRSSTFDPPNLTINAGDTVRWIRAVGSHTVTSGTNCTPDGLFDAPIDLTHTTFEFTFNSTGVVPYFCRIHCALGMTGTITVQTDPAAADPVRDSRSGAIVLSAWPNPAREASDLHLRLRGSGDVRVAVYDAGGREIALVHHGVLQSGDHQIAWSGKTDSGEDAASGIYFVRAIGAGGTAGLTLILAR